jgi:hypothetical protein
MKKTKAELALFVQKAFLSRPFPLALEPSGAPSIEQNRRACVIN